MSNDMVAGKKRWDAPISDEMLIEINNHLNDNSHNLIDPKLGKQLEFMERNGFDFGQEIFLTGLFLDKAINYFFVPEYLYHFEGPQENERVPYNIVRLIALQLRDFYRTMFDIPLLTNEEKKDWNFQITTAETPWRQKAHERMKNGEEQYITLFKLNESQANEVGRFMREHFPEIYKYMLVVEKQSIMQGYGVDDWVSRRPYFDAIDDCVEACLGEQLEYNEQSYNVNYIVDTIVKGA